jgi:hypothetical protein
MQHERHESAAIRFQGAKMNGAPPAEHFPRFCLLLREKTLASSPPSDGYESN